MGFWQLQGDYRLEEKFLAALDAVTASDVLEVCRKYIQPRRATLLFYRPKTEKGFDSGLHWQAKLEKALVAAQPLNVKRPGKNERLQRFKLSNGSKLLVRERHGVPLVSLGVYLKGGFRDEKEAQSGLTSLMTRVLLKGTEKRSYAEYSRVVESLASHVDPVLEKDYWGVTSEALSTQLDQVFNLMMETFLTPAFTKEEVEKEKQMQLAALAPAPEDDPSEYALLKSDVSTFTGTPYAHPPQGTAKSVARLSPQEVRGWYEKLRRASNMTWVAVGDVDPPQDQR